ncbi:uncharacterized protein LOC136095362 isoform X2 [Hydra vulgaris]|uniref:uncharacterized protein LOC136095362 isoform X2 n=1 Tax=Hydra vulgaris TaxID=6087 RepID=UPI0032EA4B9D
MDKLKKLEDSVENLKKLEHSMGLIFQQLKNLENSIASSAVPSAPQAIISAPMSSYAVPSAPMSSYAVPSASISSAVPSAMLIKLNFLKKRVFPAFQPNIRDFYKSTLTK